MILGLTSMGLGLAALLGFAFGFLVGHFVAVPLGATAWGGWLYYEHRQHPRPPLEGNLGTFVVIVLVGAVAASLLGGVVLRWGLRYVMQRR